MIQLDGMDELHKKLTTMIDRISYFGNVQMKRDFGNWQTATMHRKYPATRMSKWSHHQKSAATTIRPHSRYEMARSAAYQAGLRKRMKGRRKKLAQPVGHQKTSTRPILRAQLEQEWRTQMIQSFYRTLQW